MKKGNTKFTVEDKTKMQDMYLNEGKGFEEICKIFRVNYDHLRKRIATKNWRTNEKVKWKHLKNIVDSKRGKTGISKTCVREEENEKPEKVPESVPEKIPDQKPCENTNYNNVIGLDQKAKIDETLKLLIRVNKSYVYFCEKELSEKKDSSGYRAAYESMKISQAVRDTSSLQRTLFELYHESETNSQKIEIKVVKDW